MRFETLKKNLKKDFSGFRKLKAALLGNSATQLLAQAIRGMGYERQLDIDLFEAGVDQVDRLILDSRSPLYDHNPNAVIVYESGHKLLQKYNKSGADTRDQFAENEIGRISRLTDALRKAGVSTIVWCNFAEEDDRVFGNYGNTVAASFIFQVRKLNYLLSEYASHGPELFICDISTIQNSLGRRSMFAPAIYINTDMDLSIDALPAVSDAVVGILAAASGKIKKCLIVDLDNTMWGGVIGDDGLERIQIGGLGIGKAFTEFQYWVKKLRERGIIVCVCSKNSESVAKEPFEKHPDMVLRLEDIAVFVANWNNKVENIKFIQERLNIGFDSMVFVDDNPFEREMVRAGLSEVTVPEIPKDPAEYLECLYSLNLFETATYTEEDGRRTQQYKQEHERLSFRSSFEDEADFLKSLGMTASADRLDPFTLPRVAQLSQRSNQYNLRTVRYSEEELKNIMNSDSHIALAVSLKDKFGDNGIVSAAILEKRLEKELFIDSWFMSCRVLNRGVEQFVLNTLVRIAREEGFSVLIGEYVPTTKNGLVKDHYEKLGFSPEGPHWRLAVDGYKNLDCQIQENA